MLQEGFKTATLTHLHTSPRVRPPRARAFHRMLAKDGMIRTIEKNVYRAGCNARIQPIFQAVAG